MVMPGFSKCPHPSAFLSTLAAAIACLPLELGSISDLLAKLRSHPKLGRGDDCGSKGTDTTNRSTQSAESPPPRIWTRSRKPSQLLSAAAMGIRRCAPPRSPTGRDHTGDLTLREARLSGM